MDKLVVRKLSPIAEFSPILRVPYLLIVTLVIQVLSPILQVSPILSDYTVHTCILRIFLDLERGYLAVMNLFKREQSRKLALLVRVRELRRRGKKNHSY